MRWWFLVLGVGLGVLLTCLGRSILGRLGGWQGWDSPADLTAPPSGSGEPGVSPSDRQNITQLVRQLAILTQEYSDDLEAQRNQLSVCLEQAQQQRSALPGGAADIVSPCLEQLILSTTRVQQRVRSAREALLGQAVQLESDLSEARTDGLTGLVNRRAFDAKIEELFASYRAGGDSFVLALIDIDHFKQINDNFGHQAGDVVLKAVAAALRRAFDQAFLVARYGGEEFALLLPGPLRLSAARVESIRRSIAGQPIAIAGQGLRVTWSVGLSEPAPDTTVTNLIRRADEALYSAKKGGRDRVCLHDGKRCVVLGEPAPIEL
jgi:diguanylate cyclase